MTNSILFGLVAESPNDERRGKALADRVIAESSSTQSFITDLSLDIFRTWVGLESESGFLDIHDVPSLARKRGLRSLGRFSDEKAARDAHLVRQTLWLFKAGRPDVSAVVILRDSDGEQEAANKGVLQALDHTSVPFSVVCGVAHEAMEAWVLAGFSPVNDNENATLASLRKQLGYFPNKQPHRLSHKEHVKHSGKAVWRQLCDAAGMDIEERCLKAPLSELRANGKAAGLAAFLDDVEQTLVPLIGT